MKKEQRKTNKNKIVNTILVLALFCFGFLIFRLAKLTLNKEIDDINMKEFADNRSVVNKTLNAKRGSIYDVNGETLAQNVSSYTLIAYLDPIRSEGESKLYHVKDKKETAKKLATVIKLKEEEILEILNQKDLYQVEFGNPGKNLTEIEKDKIKALNLPGIDFIQDTKRYYPNGDFLSYTLGYVKKNETGKLEGEMGLEFLLDGVLKGKDGYTSYQKDLNGYKIPGTKEITILEENGHDVYLTIDTNIQYFIEQAMRETYSKYKSDWMTIVVADAKTGKILGISEKPSFDNNTLDIDNWIDHSVSEAFEPGSIMKIYTYMAAMENGTYKGDQTYKSGSYKVDDDTTIYDWRRQGFGEITYDQGLQASSNVGVINIMNNFIDKQTLYDYFTKMGFGEKTGITLANEARGKLAFTYKTEIFNASFGQGITTTPIQHIQALTSLSNDGVILKPYIIDKVVDKNGLTVFEGKKEEVRTVASHETVEKIKELLYLTVNSSWEPATGRTYKIDGYDIMGKTGTAQLVNPQTGRYYTSDYYSTKSFVGMWPKNDPEVIIYASIKKSSTGNSTPLSNTVKEIIKNVTKYLNIFDEEEQKQSINYTVENYINKKADETEKKLKENNVKYEILGNGNKIIKQYPEKDNIINTNERIILLTNDTEYEMPEIKDYSKKQTKEICNLLKLDCEYEGYGYVDTYNIKKGTKLKPKDKLKITFKERYKT